MTSFELDAMPEIAPFEFVATTENSEKQRVADILGIESSPDWEIVDRDDGAQLVMVHYVEDARTDYVKYGHLRGVVVDMEAGVAVAQSFGYNLTVVCDALTVDENSNLHIANPASGEDYVYPAHQVKISRAYDGFIIMAYRHKGVTHFSTHRKINPVNSRWGKSAKFLDIYREAGGPTEDQLFDLSMPYGSKCHIFLVAHRDLLMTTRQVVNRPYVVVLGDFNMQIARGEETDYMWSPLWQANNIMPTINNASMIYAPPPMTLEQGNDFLANGYYLQDPTIDVRMRTGEALFITVFDEKNTLLQVLKVNSSAYDWRSNMRGNEANLNHRFYELIPDSYNDFTKNQVLWNEFSSRYIITPLLSAAVLRTLMDSGIEGLHGLLSLPEERIDAEGIQIMFGNARGRAQLIWENFVLAVPLQHQDDALDLFAKFNADRDALIEWLITLERQKRSERNLIDNLTEKGIDETTVKSIQRIIGQARVRVSIDPYKTLTISQAIRGLIDNEFAISLYRMVRAVDRYKNPRVLKAKETLAPRAVAPIRS